MCVSVTCPAIARTVCALGNGSGLGVGEAEAISMAGFTAGSG